MKINNISDICICKMTLNDIDKTKILEDEQQISIISKSSFESDLEENNKIYFIAKYHDEIIAYIGISYIEDSLDILSVVVKKTYQKNGIATLLLNHILNFSKQNNIQKLFLEVRKSNIAAISLYEKLEFKNINTRKKYYPDNFEDAYIFMLEI